MAKLEKLGCSKSLVGLVVPTGFTFNTDGTSLYMTMAALFVAQATNTHLTLTQQLTILAVAVLTSKGASGVQGASFIALVATLSVIPTIPVAGMALILGIDRFLSMFRAAGQHDWERSGDAGPGALGGGIGARNAAATSSQTGLGPFRFACLTKGLKSARCDQKSSFCKFAKSPLHNVP